MKLTAAKCPSCGASIEVNKNLEKTICQYCGTTVLVEDAIAKLKIELSGKVEVDGIETRKSKLERARKHLKLNEFGDANKILSELVAKDKLDEEAYLEILKMKIQALKYDGFNGTTNTVDDAIHWQILREAFDTEARIRKIDDDHSLDDELNKLEKDLNKLKEYKNKLDEDTKLLKSAKDKLYKMLNKPYGKVVELLNSTLKSRIRLTSYYRHRDSYNGGDDYVFSDLLNLERDGVIVIKYRKETDNSVYNPSYLTDTTHVNLPSVTPALLCEKIDEVWKVYEVEKAKQEEKDRKAKKRAQFGQKVSDIIRYILYGACALLILAVVICFITGDWLTGILWALLIDSWLVPLLYSWADGL